jgi:hypothetical protein
MVSKIKKSVQNSMRKGDFKKRQQAKIVKKHRDMNEERNKFVDKKQVLAKKQEEKDNRQHEKGSQKQKTKKGEDKNEEDDVSMGETDSELERELEADNDAKDPEKLDETVFNKFTGGELDIPDL